MLGRRKSSSAQYFYYTGDVTNPYEIRKLVFLRSTSQRNSPLVVPSFLAPFDCGLGYGCSSTQFLREAQAELGIRSSGRLGATAREEINALKSSATISKKGKRKVHGLRIMIIFLTWFSPAD